MKIFIIWLRMQASPTSSTTSVNSISYSPIFFLQNFHFHARRSPPSVEFHLYDEHKEMSLYDFCRVCRIPFEGSIEEPHRNDVEGFIDMIAVGETRKFPMQESLAYIFLFYVTLQYLLVDA